MWCEYGLHFLSFSKPYFSFILPTLLWISIYLVICFQIFCSLLFCIHSCHLNTKGHFIPLPKCLDSVSKSRAKKPRKLKVFWGLRCRNHHRHKEIIKTWLVSVVLSFSTSFVASEEISYLELSPTSKHL